MEDENSHLVKFSKHIPRLLRQQILCGLMSKYVPAPALSAEMDESPKGGKLLHTVPFGPTMQRFHGALLFVDISGFTALSLKLDVEALKNHINSYFTKMLDIVDKWEGDVVKFAGDALYIVWPTNIHEQSGGTMDDSASVLSCISISNSAEFAASAKKGLDKAVGCGLEISAVCGNYEVRLAAAESPSMLSKLLPFSLGSLMGGPSKVTPMSSNSDGSPTEDVVYLNVHSGVSCGLMAGVDITHNGRAEFFLVGDPLTGVAMAESQASKGDVVLDLTAHDLLHGENAEIIVKGHLRENNESSDFLFPSVGKKEKNAEHSLLCGCSRTENGLFQVSKLLQGRGRRKTRGKQTSTVSSAMASSAAPAPSPAPAPTLNAGASKTDIADVNSKIMDEIENELEKLFLSTKSHIKKEFYSFLNTLRELSESDPRASLLMVGDELSTRRSDEKKFSVFVRDILRKHFIEWMQYSLLEGVTLHVHEVARMMSNAPSPTNSQQRPSSFQDVLRNSLHILSGSFEAPPSIPNTMLSAASAEFCSSQGALAQLLTDDLNKTATLAEKAKRTPIAGNGAISAASSPELNNGEIRTVIVMFVKIEKFDLRLKIDNKGKPVNLSYNRFFFLDRTESELQSDTLILNRVQACFEVLCQTLQDNGGQLRQFIVDDKGTVCIGTFGLRGSAAVDNAAAALEAAKNIVDGLKKLDLKASIGITSGKAYCGLVGSFIRHEYAVMGPSTNLSARLMCKAPAHGVICDADTVSRDRSHKFSFISEVQAKGYSKPVPTYNPVFNEMDEDIDDSGRKLVNRQGSTYGGGMKKTIRVVNRLSIQSAAQEVSDVMKTANLASQQKLTATQKLTALGRTDFFLSEVVATFDGTRGSQIGIMPQKLHGRDEELTQILSCIFENDASNPQLICTNVRTKMVTVCGPSGTGKTAMISALERKLQNVARTDSTCNMVILRNRTTSLQHDLPFRSWQVLLHKLFLTVLNSMSGVQGVSTTRSSIADNFSKFSHFSSVINVIWPQLPAELHDKKDLMTILSHVQSTEQWQAVSEKDKTEDKLEACSSLVAAVMSAVAKILNKLILLIIVDVQTLDKWSLITLRKIFEESVGVSVITVYDTTESSQQVDPVLLSKEGGGTLDNVTRFFQGYRDYSRFKLLFLSPLNKEATVAMVGQLNAAIGSAEVEKIYEMSAGKPLYVTELVETFSKANAGGSKAGNGLVKSSGHALAEAAPIGSISHRIEEVICYRMDKLHLAAQVVLKAAAVIVSYGRVCTYDMLKFILADNSLFTTNKAPTASYEEAPDQEEDDAGDDEVLRMTGRHSVRLALLDLMQNEDFLSIKGPLASVPRSEFHADLLLKAEMEFHIPLEQATIYSLIVDVQKEYFHERVALYIHNSIRNLPLSSVSLRDLWEKGFHWDRASHWSRALRAYVLAAKKSKEANDCPRYHESLMMAYQIFQCMEQKGSVIVLPESCQSYADKIAQAIFKPVPDNLMELETSADLILALKSAQEVFEQEPSGIAEAIELHILLAEVYLSKWEDFEVVMHLLSAAVLMSAALVWTPSRESRKITTDSPSPRTLVRKGMKPMVADYSNTYVVKPRVLTNRDYFHLFSLCAYTSRFVSIEMSFTVSVEYSKAMLALESEELVASSMATATAIHAHLIMALRYLQLGKPGRAATLLEDASKLYDGSVHSEMLVQQYSMDLMPYALGLLAQALFAEGNINDGIAHWRKALACLRPITHSYSLMIALFVLMSTVHIVDEYNVLIAQLTKLRANSQCANAIGNQMGKLLELWLHVTWMASSTSSCGEGSSVRVSSSQKLVNQFIELSKSLDKLMSGPSQELVVSSSGAAMISSTDLAPANPNGAGIETDAAKETQSTAPAVTVDVASLAQSDGCEVTLSKLSFLELHGCALERIYIETMCSLWYAASRDQLFVLEQRIQNSLQILLQSPVHDFMTVVSKGFNMMYSLAHVLSTGRSGNGLSAGAIYATVTERADQPLLLVMKMLLTKNNVYLSWLLACCVQALPLHGSIKDNYRRIWQEAGEKLSSTVGSESALAELKAMARRLDIPSI